MDMGSVVVTTFTTTTADMVVVAAASNLGPRHCHTVGVWVEKEKPLEKLHVNEWVNACLNQTMNE